MGIEISMEERAGIEGASAEERFPIRVTIGSWVLIRRTSEAKMVEGTERPATGGFSAGFVSSGVLGTAEW